MLELPEAHEAIVVCVEVVKQFLSALSAQAELVCHQAQRGAPRQAARHDALWCVLLEQRLHRRAAGERQWNTVCTVCLSFFYVLATSNVI